VVLRVLADYGQLIDGREATAWSGLFGNDGVLAVGDREIRGRAELAEFAAQSPAGVHMQSVPSIELCPDGSAYVESNFVFMNAGTGKLIAGSYHDQLVQDEDVYIFARRDISIRART
jgi:SnoaL-like domain